MKTESEIKIFITAGGKSSRMGTDKGFVEIDGKPMICYLTEMLSENDYPFTIIANSAKYEQLGYRLISDVEKDKGPMGALLTALSDTSENHILILGCDTPFISAKLIKILIENTEKNTITIFQINGAFWPLLAVYPVSILDKVKFCIANNQLKLQDFIGNNRHKIIDLSLIEENLADCFLNFNCPDDIRKWKNEKQYDYH